MRIRALILVALFAAATAVHAQSIQLVSDEEARRPSAPEEPGKRAISRGPGVKLASPESVSAGAFQFKVTFEPRGGSKVDPASVKVEYLKTPLVDITERVKPSVKPEGIDLSAVALPVGEHPFRVTVRDDEGRLGTATFNLKVK